MLSKLLIKNYALIDALEIQFDQKLNIITGETGAGKSIIMGALGLILGNRAESRHFYDESSKCVIEGHFAIHKYGLQELFQELDLDYEDHSIIRRELLPDGKSRAFVNDTPVNLQTLKTLGERLIDIHSQHATLQINTESFQLLVLDTMAKHTEVLSSYKQNFKKYKQLTVEIKELILELENSRSVYDYQQFVFNELEQANLQDGEQELLEAEQTQLENAEEIKKYLHSASEQLEHSEQNLLAGLKSISQSVQQAARFLPSVSSLSERLNSTLIELKDIASEVEEASDAIQMDEERLSIIQERLSLLYDLQKKHRLDTVEGLIKLREEFAYKLLDTDQLEDKINLAKDELNRVQMQLTALASQLSENRLSAAQEVEKEVEAVLSRVGMPHAQLKVEHKTLHEFKANGQDEISFTFSANKGMPLQPIHKVASGGELSRVMLSIKSLLAKTSALPTIIFDEIDTGISGEVALRVGELMEELAQDMQVISITHLPQIASQGRSHYKVFKNEVGERTKSSIALLNEQDRILEIAQMLSGSKPEETAISHAKEMLK